MIILPVGGWPRWRLALLAGICAGSNGLRKLVRLWLRLLYAVQVPFRTRSVFNYLEIR